MPKKEQKITEKTIGRIRSIRARNNDLWMQILHLAVKSRPRLAKKLLRSITDNDKAITAWMRKL